MLNFLKKKEGPKVVKQPPKTEPDHHEITLNLERKKPAKNVAAILKKIEFLSVENGGETVTARHVEAVDLKNQPYTYWQITLEPKTVKIQWTTPQNEHGLFRRIHVTQQAYQILTLLQDEYPQNAATLRPLILDALHEVQRFSQQDAHAFSSQFDAHLRATRRLEKQNNDLEKTLDKLNRRVSELSEENEQLKSTIQNDHRMTDESIKIAIMEHVTQNGAIDLPEFAKANQVPVTRIESALDELVKNGFLKPAK